MAMIYEERALDSVFSQFILRLRGSEEKPPFPLRIAVSMAARAAASGDVCFDLASLQGTVVEHEGLRVTMPSLNTFRALFFDSGVASAPGAFTPLVLDDKSRLYLYRYWKLEHQLAVQLLALASNPPENSISSLFPVEPGGGAGKSCPTCADMQTDGYCRRPRNRKNGNCFQNTFASPLAGGWENEADCPVCSNRQSGCAPSVVTKGNE